MAADAAIELGVGACVAVLRRFGRHLIRGDYHSTPDVTAVFLVSLVREQLHHLRILQLHVLVADHVQCTFSVLINGWSYGVSTCYGA